MMCVFWVSKVFGTNTIFNQCRAGLRAPPSFEPSYIVGWVSTPMIPFYRAYKALPQQNRRWTRMTKMAEKTPTKPTILSSESNAQLFSA